MCDQCVKAEQEKKASASIPSGSALREKLFPQIDAALNAEVGSIPASDTLTRRVLRAFARYAAKQAHARGVDEETFMNVVHEAFHEEQA